jgi:hypothetical protein
MIVEQFIRKLNNTELNAQNTNDAYIRISKVIQDFIPITFFKDLDSQKINVTEKKSKRKVDNWVRYQYYPANKEYRIANLSSIYKSYNASPGDLIYIEKISTQTEVSYIVYMKNYEKVSMKFSKSKNAFEILNLTEVKLMNVLEKDIIISIDGVLIDSKICFSISEKKRIDSPDNTDFYEIQNLPVSFTKKIDKDSFVEISLLGNKYNMEIHKSWHFNKFTK